MPALSDYLQSPAWWITAGVFGVLVSIVAVFAVRGIDKWGGWINTRWATRTAAKRRRTAQLIAGVRADVGRLVWIGFRAQSLKTSSLIFLGFGMVQLILATATFWADATRLFLVLLGVLTVTAGMSLGSRAADFEAVIRAVEPEWPQPE
jgi:hypothetical protein